MSAARRILILLCGLVVVAAPFAFRPASTLASRALAGKTTSTATATLTRAATPAVTPEATPVCPFLGPPPDPCDDDEDGYPNFEETANGSDPEDPASVPEANLINHGACNDGIDNDLDGVTDDADPGCDYDGDGVPDLIDSCVGNRNNLELCWDFDYDGYPDSLEVEVGSDPTNRASVPENVGYDDACLDGIDNDLDGLVDLSEPGCAGYLPLPGLDFSIGIGTECDSTAGPTTCTFYVGDTYTLQFKLNNIPAGFAYAAYDVFLQYTGVTFVLGSLVQQDGLWPSCAFPAAEFSVPGMVVAACTVGPDVASSTYTGVMARVDFQCSGTLGGGTITLLSALYNETDVVDDLLMPYREGVDESLTVDCVAPTPPGATPMPSAKPGGIDVRGLPAAGNGRLPSRGANMLTISAFAGTAFALTIIACLSLGLFRKNRVGASFKYRRPIAKE